MQDFETGYETYFARVYGFTLSLCRNAALAEEIAQSAFIKAYFFYHFDQITPLSDISAELSVTSEALAF